MNNRDLRYSIRSGRDGSVFRAAIALPSRHGEIIFTSAVPVAAVAELREGLRAFTRENVGFARRNETLRSCTTRTRALRDSARRGPEATGATTRTRIT